MHQIKNASTPVHVSMYATLLFSNFGLVAAANHIRGRNNTLVEFPVERDYLVKVKTGDKLHAGTNLKHSNLYLTLFGDLGSTTEHYLNSYISAGNAFQKGELNNFTLVGLEDVGVVRNITIRNGGQEEEFEYSWYLDWISVDSNTAIFNRWIGDGESVSASFATSTFYAPSSAPTRENTNATKDSEDSMLVWYVLLATVILLLLVFIMCVLNLCHVRDVCGCFCCCVCGCCSITCCPCIY